MGGVDARVAEITALVDGFVAELTDRVDDLADRAGSVQLAEVARQVERAVRAGEGVSGSVVSSVDRRRAASAFPDAAARPRFAEAVLTLG